MRGAAAGVDVAPVGAVGENRDVRAEAPEDLGGDAVGRAVGAVQQHVEPVEAQIAEARVQLAQVVLVRSRAARAPCRSRVAARHPARVPVPAASAALAPPPPPARPQRALDLELVLVGELEAVGAEELDAVVLVGVVRGGDHGGEVEAVARDQQRRGRRRQHAAEQRVSPGRADAGRERGLQHLAGLARVANDQHLRAPRVGQRGRGAAEAQRELGG